MKVVWYSMDQVPISVRKRTVSKPSTDVPAITIFTHAAPPKKSNPYKMKTSRTTFKSVSSPK